MVRNHICALDIGSSKIAATLVELKGKRIANLSFAHAPSKGVKRGSITDAIDLVNCIGKVLRTLKSHAGIHIKSVYVNISGPDIMTKHSRAIIPLAERGNKVITPTDVQRVNEQARILGSGLEDEIIHQIPFGYTIDSSSNIFNPVGLYSHRLETDLFLVCAKVSAIQSLVRAVHQAGFEIKNLFFSGLAVSKAVLGGESAEGNTILCDIGSDITELLVFKDGGLRDIKILNLGGDDLTIALAQELKLPFDLAEDVKVTHASIGETASDKEILLKKNHTYKPIKQRAVSEIVTAKAGALCETLKDTLSEKVSFAQVNSFVVTGRTVLLEGFLEDLEHVLGIPVHLGRMNPSDYRPASLTPRESQALAYRQDIHSLVRKDHSLVGLKYLTYITSLGIICHVLDNEYPLHPPFSEPARNFLFKTAQRFKEVYQEYF